MFSVFASKDRRANYELLLFIYDTFTQDECSQAIEKGELVDKFAEYIKQHSFNELDDDDGVDILAKTAKEKANFKLRQFKRCGWLEEDNSEGFNVFVSMTDNAIALMETFKNLISKRNRPLEYTGYFYVIYETLRNFDYQKSKALIEQVVKNTTELFNHLQGLHSTIKDYISKLMVRKDLKPQDVLDLLLNKYQNQVVLTVFNNLKGRDNPSKYTSEILSKLRELRYEKLREVTENYAITAGLKDPTEEQYSEIESDLRNDLDYVIDRFESVDELISIIDRKNSRFHRSALSTINFLMNNRNDINTTPYIGRKASQIRLEQVRSRIEELANLLNEKTQTVCNLDASIREMHGSKISYIESSIGVWTEYDAVSAEIKRLKTMLSEAERNNDLIPKIERHRSMERDMESRIEICQKNIKDLQIKVK